MTRDEILQIAIDCKLLNLSQIEKGIILSELADGLIEFYNLATARERDACAKVCDEHNGCDNWYISMAIRARGEKVNNGEVKE